jgi:Cu/Ag efflux protein CusF
MPESDTGEIVTDGHPTEQLRITDTASVPVVTSTELDALFPDEADEWPAHGPKKGFRVTWPVAALIVLAVAAGGIWGGAYLQRHHSSTSSAASLFGSFRRGAGGSGGTGSTGSGGAGSGAGGIAAAAAASNLTAGTVTDIIGNTLYVTNSSGDLVEVTIGSNTTVNRNAKSTLSELKPGDTVTVTGTKSSNGALVASTVSATQAGVSSGFGGFGGGGGAGGFGGFSRRAAESAGG